MPPAGPGPSEGAGENLAATIRLETELAALPMQSDDTDLIVFDEDDRAMPLGRLSPPECASWNIDSCSPNCGRG